MFISDEVTRGLDFVYTYIDDDRLIASANAAEHEHHLRQLFERFQQYGVVINPAKSVFGVATIQFLGHTVNRHGIQPVESKIQATSDFPPRPTLTKLREFLGLVNFYGRFIPKCSHIVQPLTDMLGSTGAATKTKSCKKRQTCKLGLGTLFLELDIFGPNRRLKIKTTSQKAYCRNWELGLLTVGTGDYKIQNGGQLNINSKTERNIIFMELM